VSAHVILFDSENDLLAACIKQPRSFSRLSEAKKLRMCDGGDLPAFSKPVALRAWPGAGKTSGGSRVHHEIGRYRHFLYLKLRWFGGNHNWLVVWNIWTIYMFPSILGMSSSQLTNSNIFRRGGPTTGGHFKFHPPFFCDGVTLGKCGCFTSIHFKQWP